MIKKKVIYVISFIDKALIYDWQIEFFSKQQIIEICYVIMNPGSSFIEDKIKQHGLKFYRVEYRGKRDFFKALSSLYRIIKIEKPDFINTNLFDAGMVGQIAAYLARVPNRIHSRHYSSLHHVYHRHAVIYDKLLNKICTRIVVATEMVKKFMIEKENADPNKITVINYGFNLDKFSMVESSRIEIVRNKYNLVGKGPIIGVISRFVEWKGIQYIIPAFKRLLEIYPNSLLVLANAAGDYTPQIKSRLQELQKGSYREILFEQDSPALYKSFDIFVHVPVDYHSEAFGQTYIEALAAGIPSVFTYSGIANDFIEPKYNALVVPYRNSEAIFSAIIELLSDKNLYQSLKMNGENSVVNRFTFEKMMVETMNLYK